MDKTFLISQWKNDLRTYDDVAKITIGQEDDYATRYLLDYPCFKEIYKLIAKYLSNQQALDADRKEMQQTNFSEI